MFLTLADNLAAEATPLVRVTSIEDLAGIIITSGQVTATSGISPEADLSITKTDSPDPVIKGENLTYTIAVTNNGPDGAPSAVVTDTLPGNVTFVSATSSQGSCSESGGTVTCNLGTLANGATATVTIVVTTPAVTGTLSSTASVTSDAIDSDTTNNSATQSTVVTLPAPHVPTLTQWGVIALAGAAAVVLAVGATLQAQRRRRGTTPR